MKIVFDTNVMISGVFFGGVPGLILAAWNAGELSVVLSASILAEYREVGLNSRRSMAALASNHSRHCC